MYLKPPVACVYMPLHSYGQCDCRPPEWAQQMQVNHKQPFYSVLPDEHDCTRLFQGGRTSKYVAQVPEYVPFMWKLASCVPLHRLHLNLVVFCVHVCSTATPHKTVPTSSAEDSTLCTCTAVAVCAQPGAHLACFCPWCITILAPYAAQRPPWQPLMAI